MTLETLNSMAQVLDSMENAVKLRNQARAEKRAEEAEQAKKAFQEKLLAAAATETELDSLASRAKGSHDAVLRDQLITGYFFGKCIRRLYSIWAIRLQKGERPPSFFPVPS